MFTLLALGTVLAIMLFAADGIWAGILGILSNGGRPPRLFLLLSKGVLEGLNATKGQKEMIKSRVPNFMKKVKNTWSRFLDVPEAERGEKVQQVVKKLDAVAARRIPQFLKPDQLKRFVQMERQFVVPQALLNDAEVSKSLKIGDEQRKKIAAINDELTKEIGELNAMLGEDDASEIPARFLAALEQVNEKAIQALTDEQRKKWQELIGEPFDLSALVGTRL